MHVSITIDNILYFKINKQSTCLDLQRFNKHISIFLMIGKKTKILAKPSVELS